MNTTGTYGDKRVGQEERQPGSQGEPANVPGG